MPKGLCFIKLYLVYCGDHLFILIEAMLHVNCETN